MGLDADLVSNGAVPNSENRAGVDWIPLYFVGLLLVALLLVVAAIGQEPVTARDPAVTGTGTSLSPFTPAPTAVPQVEPTPAPGSVAPNPGATYPTTLPGGRSTVFGGNRVLVAYYGTAGTGSLGVLGEASPERIMPRLTRAARPFAVGGRRVQPVFELIVTVAHASPTKTGTYSSDIDRAKVKRYIAAAHRHGVLVVLDLQPGKANFLTVAKRWEWALKDPYVGLALDPEWRMSRGGVPGRRIGSVSANEVNRVSRWLSALTTREQLPQKVFLLHQFRTDMIRGITKVRDHRNLAEVQHVDGYGPPKAKLATFHAVAQPRQFALGFKLFYDEDVPRMRPAQVLRIKPRVSFVSFQ
ncbi:MAG: hypothetical protein JWQ74_334 [Marmoricola sp.]|nr:hypothetical protein [Marmoricola sp.]